MKTKHALQSKEIATKTIKAQTFGNYETTYILNSSHQSLRYKGLLYMGYEEPNLN
jgi:hypothetical protein